ncbi:hypothetical protein [Lacticaseibacillus paracasei]|uniref:hypothetical protein n=1 Tax=Lacticaseibacillus paracasei TaxID=1597 RepID=UPI003D7B29D7
MKKKIKHAIAYVLLVSWAGIVIYGFASFLWDLVVKPFVKLGIVKSLTTLIFAIGAATVACFVFWAGKKLIDWLLEE